MDVNQELIEETRARIRAYLPEIYPDFVEFDDSTFTVQQGSATVSVIVRGWHENDCAVEFTSQMVSGGNITPEVMRWLLAKNVELHFGGFGLLFDDTIVYSQTLPGGDLSTGEFEATVRTVAMIADHYDDEICTLAGGKLGSHAPAADAVATE